MIDKRKQKTNQTRSHAGLAIGTGYAMKKIYNEQQNN